MRAARGPVQLLLHELRGRPGGPGRAAAVGRAVVGAGPGRGVPPAARAGQPLRPPVPPRPRLGPLARPGPSLRAARPGPLSPSDRPGSARAHPGPSGTAGPAVSPGPSGAAQCGGDVRRGGSRVAARGRRRPRSGPPSLRRSGPPATAPPPLSYRRFGRPPSVAATEAGAGWLELPATWELSESTGRRWLAGESGAGRPPRGTRPSAESLLAGGLRAGSADFKTEFISSFHKQGIAHDRRCPTHPITGREGWYLSPQRLWPRQSRAASLSAAGGSVAVAEGNGCVALRAD